MDTENLNDSEELNKSIERNRKVLVIGGGSADAITAKTIKDKFGDDVVIVSQEEFENQRKGDNKAMETMGSQLVHPYINPYKDMEGLLNDFHYGDVPNGIKIINRLNLTKKQADDIMFSPAYRLDDEPQELYKKRRELSKLLTKYRGQYNLKQED